VAGEEGRAVRGGVEAGVFGAGAERDLSPLRGWRGLGLGSQRLCAGLTSAAPPALVLGGG